MKAAGATTRRGVILGVLGAALVVGPGLYLRARGSDFPPDTTPQGAYLRVVIAVREDHLERVFAYLETGAQWACHSIVDYRRRSQALIASSYPEPERARLLALHARAASAADGEAYFASEARARGWEARLRTDLSGIASVEVEGERATVQTVRGTRYSFRRRENGIWGLTTFTAELQAEATAAARDHAVIERAARDYGATP
ncbi:MAG: hypothetical protein EOO75_09350 [Myxococcales bacterium]|nr:MAG: hypothetical protein EOO75_09350 [Myxococcales bacterium]